MFDTDGKRYLDFASGVAANAFGHANPYLVSALIQQADKVWHTSNMFRIAGLERAAERLVRSTFAELGLLLQFWRGSRRGGHQNDPALSIQNREPAAK